MICLDLLVDKTYKQSNNRSYMTNMTKGDTNKKTLYIYLRTTLPERFERYSFFYKIFSPFFIDDQF